MIQVAARLIACCGLAYLAWRSLGAVGLVYSAPVFGVAFARPILDAGADLYRLVRSLAYRDVSGRHHAYKGRPIDVVVDSDGDPWLRASDVRGVIPDFPRDEALRAILGPGGSTQGKDGSLRVGAGALHAYLVRSTAAESIRFKVWIQRTVIYPARRARQLGEFSAGQASAPGKLPPVD